MNIYLIVLALYSITMIVLGALASRRVRGSSDFFVAGRGLGAGYLAVTLIAANIGAGSTVGAAGLGYRDGLSAWWWVGSAGIGSLVLAFWVGPRIWNVAREHGLLTVGDYLEHRFSRGVRMTAAVFLWLASLIILSGQLIAVAWVLNVVAGANKTTGCLLAGVVATVYFSTGGLHSAVRVNLLQTSVKLAGFMLALVFALKAAGAIDGLTESVGSRLDHGAAESYFGFTGRGLSAVSLYLVTIVPSFIISPGLLQKVFGARDQKSVRWGVAINAVVLLLFAIIPVALGMIARGELPALANRELAMPAVMTEILPLWLGTLTLAAVFSAEVSTADAVLFMLTTSISKDLYKGVLRPAASDEQLLRFTRWCAVACGAGGVVCALMLETVIGALTVFYSIITAVFFLPIIAGLYWPPITARAVLATIWVTASVLFLFEVWPRVDWRVPSLVPALAAGALTAFIYVRLRPARSRGQTPHF